MKKLAAFICETRIQPNLIQVINNHLKYLPSDTDLFIYQGEDQRFFKKLYRNAHLTEVSSMSITEYNQLLTSPTFWQQFLGYQRVLVFQSDSMLLRSGIEEFLEMDYGFIGAPIWHTVNAYNGGLSLRDPKLMYEICNTHTWEATNEDMWYCKIISEKYPKKLPPKEVCTRFSVESIFALGSLGVHSPQSWLTKEECEQIFSQYDK